MSEVTSGESATTEQAELGDTVDSISVSDLVVDRSAEEYARKLKQYANENEKRRAQEKQLKKQLEDAQAKIKAAGEEKLKEQGQWQAAYETSKGELEQAKLQLKKMQTTFAYKTVTSQIKEHAIRNGCVDSEAMIKLATANGLLDSVEPDEEFNLAAETVKNIVLEAQKSMPYLFGKQAPTIRDGTPPGKPDLKTGFESLSLRERTLKLAELLVKQQRS